MKNKLRSLMAANGDNYASLAKKMGTSTSVVCKKVNGRVRITWQDMKFIKNLYNLSAEQMDALFFSE